MASLVERLREHATDWDGRQMPDAEPAKGDPTAGTLRQAADRITALEAEIERLAGAWKLQHKEKMKERAEAKLWFERAQEWRAELTALQAMCETLAGALDAMRSYGCPVCNGDCSGANPPVIFCPMTQCHEALTQYRAMKEKNDANAGPDQI